MELKSTLISVVTVILFGENFIFARRVSNPARTYWKLTGAK